MELMQIQAAAVEATRPAGRAPAGERPADLAALLQSAQEGLEKMRGELEDLFEPLRSGWEEEAARQFWPAGTAEASLAQQIQEREREQARCREQTVALQQKLEALSQHIKKTQNVAA